MVIAGLGWVFTNQLIDLTAELPKYRDNLITKVRDVRGAATRHAGRCQQDDRGDQQGTERPATAAKAVARRLVDFAVARHVSWGDGPAAAHGASRCL